MGEFGVHWGTFRPHPSVLEKEHTFSRNCGRSKKTSKGYCQISKAVNIGRLSETVGKWVS